MANITPSHATKQLLSGYTGIIFGGFGIHKFVLGYSPEGSIMMIVSVLGIFFAYGIPFLIMQLVGLIEGMVYLNKSHEDFVDTYFVKRQGWF
ncbi:TM2 domain-containing protein [Calothrix sp. PCC 6303]|uniref:TM2 domain-containing protein n=1 Tax=Calothrix sp. PCC 6303 TaxID=1170562 RepID=UPI0002A0166D|nr:NINE protein [Calothrix sp. PCC 6303]AFZ02561.1 hypothetical protein Cal6303_3636 [Calothrix sp. PCC 6303]